LNSQKHKMLNKVLFEISHPEQMFMFCFSFFLDKKRNKKIKTP
jgi:hypothetical protein